MSVRIYPIGIDQNSVLGSIDTNLTVIRSIIEHMNFRIEKIEEYTDEELEKIKLLIIPAKVNYKFTAKEIRIILDNILRGLNLLVLLSSGGDCRLNNNLQEILEPLGIYIRCDEVADENGNLELKLKVSEKHSLLEDVYEIYYVEGCSFLVKKRVTTEIVLYSKSAKRGELPIVVAARYGNGRIVVVGSYKIFDDEYMKNYSNARLFINILLWLTRTKLSAATIETILSSAGVKAAVEIPMAPVEKIEEIPEIEEEKKIELISKEEIEMLKKEILESVSEAEIMETLPLAETSIEAHKELPQEAAVEEEVPKETITRPKEIVKAVEQKPLTPLQVEEEVIAKPVEEVMQPSSTAPAQPAKEEIISGRGVKEIEELVKDIIEFRNLLNEFIQDLLALNNKLIKGVAELNRKLEKIERKLKRTIY